MTSESIHRKKPFNFALLFLLAIVSTHVKAQIPNISYANNTQTYTTGTAISPLVVTNTGGAVPAKVYGQVTTFAGSGTSGNANGSATTATFSSPNGIAIDAAGNLYTADIYNHLIRKITPAGAVTTLAGSGIAGNTNGTGTQASFSHPSGVAVDAAGNVYVADPDYNLIRKISPVGVVTTFAGSGAAGRANGIGTAASFYGPTGVAVDATGNVYVADQSNNLIRKINPAGDVTTLAGSGAEGNTNGAGTAASFFNPCGVAVDATGNVYVADADNYLVRKISPTGVVTTLAGSGIQGSTNGTGTAASFYRPYSVAVDAIGTVYLADAGYSVIRKITATGVVTTLAGNGVWARVDGTGTEASLTSSRGVVVDPTGNVYVADWGNNVIRKIGITGYSISPTLPDDLTFDATTGIISGTPTVSTPQTAYTITGYNLGGSSSTTVSLTINSTVTLPPAVAAPAITYANDAQVYTVGTAIGSLTPNNTGGAVPATIYGRVTTLAGNGTQGKANGSGTAASFNLPFGITADAAGTAYVADEGNDLIRKITVTGEVSTFAGSGIAGNVNGTGVAASFNHPDGITVDAAGRVYVADYGNNKIRKISPSGLVSAFAGDGNTGNSNGSSAASANFNHPMGVAADASGNVYVADEGNNLIRKITSAGVVSTLAGNTNGAGKVNGTGTSASFNGPAGVATDFAGNVYVADYANSLIRKISPTGVVTTLAGSGSWGDVNGIGVAASFRLPEGVTVDANGNVYVADSGNNLIRKINSAGVVTTLAGSGAYGSTNGTGTTASFNFPTGVAVDGAGNLLVADAGNNQIRKVCITGYTISEALPAGLSFDVTTGIISGTPNALSAPKTYTITAYNAGGSSSVNITISVGNSKSSGTLPGKNYGDADFSAAASGAGPFTYHSSNTSVATISNSGLVHIAGAGTANFVISDGSHINTQSLVVSKVPLTIAANNQNKTYGAANPALTATYTGFVNGDTEVGFSTQPTVTTTAAITSVVGTYPITISGTVTNNYTITYTNATLTVNKAPLTITADNQSKAYGADNPGLSLSYSGLVLGESIAVFSKQATISTTATKTSTVGNYTILITGATANNYAFLYNNAILTVSKAPLIIAAINQNKTYGAINPALTAAYSGFVNGETSTVLAIPPTVATTANSTSAAGTYPISVSGAVSSNYTISYTAGTLTVNKALLTIRADNQTKYQGDANPVLTASYSGFVNGDSKVQLSTQPVISTTATTSSPTGAYIITVSGAVSNNYSFSYLSGTLTVGQEAITFNPIPARTYGTTPFSAGASGDAAVNYSSSNPSVAIVDNGQIRIMSAGTTTITVGDGTHIKTQTLTINKAPLTITASNQSKTYGATNPTLTATYTGFVNGDTQSALSTQPTFSTIATAASSVGSYPINVSGAVSGNYVISYANGTLTVDKAPLAITADDKSKTYGAANPALTISYSGFVNGETAAVLSPGPTVNTNAVATSLVGDYAITANGAGSSNYLINYVPGTLSVITAPAPVITSVSPSTVTAGTSVTITGSHLLGTTSVSFGGLATSSFVINSSTSISAVVPAGASNGMSVTTTTGTGSFSNVNFVPVPTITAGGPTTILTGSEVVLTATPGSGYAYQWSRNGVIIGDATSASYTATQGGVYTMQLTLNSVSQVSLPLNVTTVFTLPASNFRLLITGATCKGSNTGSLNITAIQNLNYTATISGNSLNGSYPFNASQTINNLAAGTYNICITVAGQPDYQQCFNIVITEPKDLSVFSTVNTGLNTVNLVLNGSTQYNITLNGTSYTTTDHVINLPLISGINKLSITADQLCQGMVEQTINNSGNILPYPNPFEGIVNLNLGMVNIKDVTVEIHRVSNGSLVLKKQYVNQSGVLPIDVSELQSGIYALKLSLNGSASTFKIMKK